MSESTEWMTAGEARERLRISKGKFGQLVTLKLLETRDSPLDGRVKLVRRSDVERLLRESGRSPKQCEAVAC